MTLDEGIEGRAASPAPQYPAELERDVQLRDGSRLHVRPIRADDATALIALYDRLSRQTAHQRFVATMRRLPPDWARYLASVDYVRRLALLATIPGAAASGIAAVARYETTSKLGTAEVAFVVQDGWQDRGLGTLLFGLLLEAARARGVVRFCASILADNKRMLDLVTRLAEVQKCTEEHGVVELIFNDCRARGIDASRGALSPVR
jgi:GNAT superfamily N-acetyltransferase